MHTVQTNITENTIFHNNKKIFFPEGIPAFESVSEFTLVANEEEAPFLWLQAALMPNLAFITIDPFLIYPDYRPDICDEDVQILQLSSEEEAFVLSVVTIHNTPPITITTNLVSPIIINWKKSLGKQVILKNHIDYSVKHRIDDQTNS